ncbi:MAG: hypothetical protein OXC48_05170, partial [Endozoicomonadaceae bacterium]|nr:hypothetical protein [Endozoicomonadaceae bacterium]
LLAKTERIKSSSNSGNSKFRILLNRSGNTLLNQTDNLLINLFFDDQINANNINTTLILLNVLMWLHDIYNSMYLLHIVNS